MVNKKDFIELDFTAKANGEVFDTTLPAEAGKLGLKDVKPLIMAVGQGMVIQGLDEYLQEKNVEVGKSYTKEISPEKAFGKRNPSMIKMVPIKLFLAQEIYPQKGMQLNLDGMIAKVISVSGGRVLVDFNHPLSGKNVVYDFTIKRKVEKQEEKINALQDFFFKQKFQFEIKDNKIILKMPEQFKFLAKVFEKPFKELLNLEVSIEPQEEPAEKQKQEIKIETKNGNN